MLTGAELLAKVHELGDTPRDELAIACGYKTPAGKPAYAIFQEALLQAKGVSLAPPSTAKAKGRGKAPSYEVTINKQGIAPIGSSYITEAGWGPGDKLKIACAGNRIILDRIVTASAPSEAASSASEAAVTDPAPTAAAAPSAGAPEAALAPF